MSPNLPPDLITKLKPILLPYLRDKADREAIFIETYFLRDPRPLDQISFEGTPEVFTIRCIADLIQKIGCLAESGDRQHALAALLQTVRARCGDDKHAEIDSYAALINALCVDDQPKPALPLPPVSPSESVQTIATPRDDRTPTVFISYSHADDAFAQKLIADLNAAGHACWIDTSAIKGGDEWIMTIADGIINSYAFVPIVTLKALQSRWVQDEILWARNKNKLIIPLILEDVLGHTRFFPLVSYQGVTLFDSDYVTALPRLLSYLPAPRLPDVDVNDDETSVIVSNPSSMPDRRRLELAYMERLQLEELLNTEKYTAMGGTAQVQGKAEMRAVFELLPMGRDREQAGETRRFENAVEEIQAIRRCVLLGEPGGGKTTTIWKLASDLVDTALKDRAAPLPILIRLGKWTDASQPLADFIASQMGDLGAHLDALLSEKRAALLLDGLNELPASQHKTKYPQVQAFVEQYPDLLAVVSCRELDYTIDLGFDKVNITPLDPLRIREFAGRYLGEEKGDDLFWKLAGKSAANWYKQFTEEIANELEDPERIFWMALQLPDGVEWGYSWQNKWQNWLKEREKPSGLMVLARNPYMLLMLTSVYADEGKLPDNRGQLFAKFVETLLDRESVPEDEQTPLIEGLAKVAYEMQIKRANGDAGDALTVLEEAEVEAILGERLLYLAGSASILSVGEQVRFTHQLLQEYFAAKYMDIEIAAGRLKADSIWKPENWWERTNWEEAVILLAGLYSDDCSPVIEWANAANPEVAASCVMRSGAKLADATREKLRGEWLSRLTDTRREPNAHARAAIGRALGLTNWDDRKGVSVIIRDGVKLPDIDWVKIPAGEFTMGHQDESDNPPRILTLDYDFHIARYPVTYAQFQTFIDDPEGFYNPRWWDGLSIPDGHNKAPGDQAFKFWNHPRERVSWYDAVAFCRWLSDKLGFEVRLPTEFEWEKAARANTDWQYPYGDQFNAAKGNTRETGIGQTSAVGIFLDGDTPHWEGQISDLSGNVWEWCLTDYSNPQADATQENISSSARRVLRGGSWDLGNSLARAASRFDDGPGRRDLSYGFRVLCVRPPSR